MKPSIDVNAISDGKRYHIKDQVKADARGCESCSACCHDVGELVSLTPKDVYDLKSALNIGVSELFDDYLEIRIENKIHMPYLRMNSESKHCIFLNQAGFCSVHSYRPDICRLFPLARVYEDGDYYYILQKKACVKPNLDYTSVEKWLGIPHYVSYKTFLLNWHNTLSALRFRLKFVRDEETLSDLNKIFLESFYDINPLENDDFYRLFEKNFKENKEKLGIL